MEYLVRMSLRGALRGCQPLKLCLYGFQASSPKENIQEKPQKFISEKKAEVNVLHSGFQSIVIKY
ncbi:hypothetical protein FZC84_21870 [Rossellomorea vietnamensis]|uniref:Uncharacterized protein n=1 Tax=Rossellomorea vietnamensis TaxID=218284 RepID=A0A5D4M0W7_9BACI|nr:hypothetical protein [Rossellomorea vietnamensis]TYR95172.1 hypothetical protein FZC84_21870 [Rossellomorea vietnamensis]